MHLTVAVQQEQVEQVVVFQQLLVLMVNLVVVLDTMQVVAEVVLMDLQDALVQVV
jgi:hypothetical protein|tara:strand:- start:110 stop:274 length:165 start_codon:yes stop_codon:yes gene_type:complete